MKDRPVTIKTPQELEVLRRSGKVLARITEELKKNVRSGIRTEEINKRAEELIGIFKAQPAFKGYKGFPASVCVSLNQEVVHGIPGKRIIQDGDVVSVDIGIIFENYFTDTAFTVGVGRIDEKRKHLLFVTENALYKGIEQARPGNHLSDISFAVQSFVEANGLSIVRDFVGHGIGIELHEEPEVPNYGLPHAGPILKEGMVLAIEPMVNLGTWKIKILEDGWTVVTEDGQPSAHFEHTVAITQQGPEILTK